MRLNAKASVLWCINCQNEGVFIVKYGVIFQFQLPLLACSRLQCIIIIFEMYKLLVHITFKGESVAFALVPFLCFFSVAL